MATNTKTTFALTLAGGRVETRASAKAYTHAVVLAMTDAELAQRKADAVKGDWYLRQYELTVAMLDKGHTEVVLSWHGSAAHAAKAAKAASWRREVVSVRAI